MDLIIYLYPNFKVIFCDSALSIKMSYRLRDRWKIYKHIQKQKTKKYEPITYRCKSWFGKDGGTRDQIANILWIIEKAKEFHEKNIYFCFIDYSKDSDCVNHRKLWKILQEMGIPDHLSCLLRNLHADQEQQFELDVEKRTGSKLGKEYTKAVYCHPAYLTSIQSTSCGISGWMNHKLESSLQG